MLKNQAAIVCILDARAGNSRITHRHTNTSGGIATHHLWITVLVGLEIIIIVFFFLFLLWLWLFDLFLCC
jgi:hypothetical protein